jgi:hypothetical protein
MVAIRRLRRSLTLAAWITALVTSPLLGQSAARVRVSENVRSQPNGEVVARVEPGASFAVAGREDRWLQVDLVGWVWSRSLQAADRPDFGLVVSEPQGENLRDAPSGAVLGRLGRGTYLEELERRPGWIRVRRRAWIWGESVVETSTATAAATPSSPSTSASAPATPGAAAQRPGGFVTVGGRGAAVLSAPDGDTLARTLSGADLEVVSREGNWARVRLEGWTWLPGRDTASAPTSSAAAALSPKDLAANPEAHRGRVVSWQLQFISLERAEKVRTDFFEGEPFLLTRFGGTDGAFVYVALSADRVQEFQGLVPLERLRVTGRVRTGASSLTGTPILDLVALERVRAPG